MTEIKPCPNPWCSSHRRPDRNYAPFVESSRVSAEKAVSCPVCPMRGPWADTEAEAITAWNTRNPDPSLLAALAGLVRAVNTNELAAAMACHDVAAFANVEEALKPALTLLSQEGGQ